MKYCYQSRLDLSKIYDDINYNKILLEGIEEKIPKILNLVPDEVQLDGKIHDVKDPESKASLIRFIATTFDPTPNAMYITWILKMLKTGHLRGAEDRAKYREVLDNFTKLKLKPQFPPQYKDINKYKSFGDLSEIVDQFLDIKSKKETVRIAREEGIELVDTDGEYKLYIVTTPEAGSKYFRNTEWCVKDPKHFNNYSPPFYFFTKNDNPYTLLHLNSNQCMDIYDRDKKLNHREQSMMETEEMTQYVIEHDNSDDAISFYISHIGEGYDNQISSIIWDSINEIIQDANKELSMFDIMEPQESLEYYTPEANGFIAYDFSKYEDYIDSSKFQDAVKDVLSDFDIYPEYFDSDHINSHGVTFTIYSDSYGERDIKSELNSFSRDLHHIEDRFDPIRFDETLKEKLLDYGIIKSGWSTFINKINLDQLQLKKFEYIRNEDKISLTVKIDFPISRYDEKQIFSSYTTKYKRSDHPYVLLAEFLKPLLDNGIKIYMDNNSMTFKYDPSYDEETTPKQYMRELKTLKSLDTHFEFYYDQIQNFLSKYVMPYFLHYAHTGRESYGIPDNIKLPLLKIKGRKDSEAQQMLDLHEKNKFSKLLNHHLLK